MACSRKSTMGFAPDTVQQKSKWLQDDGKKFVSIVQENVNKMIGKTVIIEDEQELINRLEETIAIRGDNDEVINEVVRYSVQLCVGRVRLDNRLTSIREDMIRLEPRGCYGRNKGCLPMNEIRGVAGGSLYDQFLQHQKQFR